VNNLAHRQQRCSRERRSASGAFDLRVSSSIVLRSPHILSMVCIDPDALRFSGLRGRTIPQAVIMLTEILRSVDFHTNSGIPIQAAALLVRADFPIVAVIWKGLSQLTNLESGLVAALKIRGRWREKRFVAKKSGHFPHFSKNFRLYDLKLARRKRQMAHALFPNSKNPFASCVLPGYYF